MAPGTYPADRPNRTPRSDSAGNARSKHRNGVPRTPGQCRPPPPFDDAPPRRGVFVVRDKRATRGYLQRTDPSGGLMRIPALAVLAVLLVSLFAVAGSASAAGRNGNDYVVPGSYIVVLDGSANVSRQVAEHERRDGVQARRVFRTAL